MARDDNKTVLEGQAAIDLWLQGKEAWNTWVEENPIADVSFVGANFAKYGEVSFSGYRFPKGRVNFAGAHFGDGHVIFAYVNFGEGDVNFNGAEFGMGHVNFSSAHFGEGHVNFLDAHFGEGPVTFAHAQFGEGHVFFSDARFGEGHVNFYNTRFGEGHVFFDRVYFGEGHIGFSDTHFGEGNVIFARAHFGEGNVSFTGAHFGEGHVGFAGARFGGGDVSFFDTHFGEGHVDFNSIKLSGQFNFSDVARTEQIKSLSFKFATFDGPVSLDGDNFNCVPDFTNTKLSHQLSLSHFTVKTKVADYSKLILKILIVIQKIWFGSPLHYSRTKSTLKRSNKLSKRFPWLSKTAAADKKDIDRIRRLKELAETNKHHKLALDLHVEEMKCSRWIETPWHQLLTEFLFQKLGDYGRSIFRPTLSLVLLWLTCAPIYAYSSDKKDITYDALLFSFSQMFSIIPSSKDARSESSAALYGTLVNDELVVDIPHAVFAVAGFQSLASIALVFLIGLALRNRFRI
ncbi:hypothetical protein [Pseudoalteromonas sp. McH1-42]|uniref:hypothetical protein n=1 Tax=Pseudoalteromonas sp. McH1-42 TaxID=2917752 RepID=UPI001EF617C5|nr:hypothetical protein [Pseudoalteromonas sp. McH1-42]MCG7561485.1 hypothetical protein [Pseudoalteromonas sp. McH1-42]